jgi:hypothetical protein
MYSARGQRSIDKVRRASERAEVTRTRSVSFSRPARFLLATLCAGLIAGCSASTSSTPPPAVTRSSDMDVVLTLADNGRHVEVGKNALIETTLPYSNSSVNRWELVTSGPGIREVSSNASSAGPVARHPVQNFSFKWTRTTPFGLVFFLEAPGHRGRFIKEFAVVLDSNASQATHPAKPSRSGTHK